MIAPPPASLDRSSGSGHGKMILVGEHHVMTGATALACGLADLRTVVALERVAHDDDPACVTMRDDGQLPPAALALAGRMVEVACRGAGLQGRLTASADSTVPVGRGLGSSAALSVAAVRAAVRLATGADAAQDAGVALAREVEGVAHGRSSGLDPAAAWASGAVLFRDGRVLARPVARAEGLRDARWVLLDSGPGAPTRQAIAVAQAARAELGPARTQSLADATTQAAQDAARALESGDLPALADALTRAGAALEPLGVVDANMARLLSLGRTHGALAAKQTGAGLGGMLLLLAPDPDRAAHLCQALQPWTSARFVLPVA